MICQNVLSRMNYRSDQLSLPRYVILAIAVISLILFVDQESFAQTQDVQVSLQTTLSGDLENDPIAQDILKKIEQTKQWVTELEQREYEKLQAQRELEEKRAQALASLEKDLAAWEKLWEKFTLEYKMKTHSGVFSDYYNFTWSKITAGRDALKKVLDNGGTFEEAQQAYIKAAEIKRIEMIEINSQINIKYGLAYYDQQLLFNSEGQFIPTPYNLAKLHEYYTDYRLDPTYILANPYDKFAIDSTRIDPDTHCTGGEVLIHRTSSDDYVCVTKSTSQMWVRYDIGKVVGEAQNNQDENSLSPSVKTNPNTKCRNGYMVIYYIPTEDYSCVLESTAIMLIDDGSADTHNLVTFIQNKEKNLETENEVYDVNQEILQINKDYDIKHIELSHKYDKQYRDLESQKKKQESQLVNLNFNTIVNEELSKQILQIRDSFESKKEKILEEKSKAIDEIKSEYDAKILSIKREYRNSEELKIVFNSSLLHYEAVKI